MAEKYLVHLDGEPMEIELDRDDDRTLARFGGDGFWHQVDLQQVLASGLYVLLMDNRPIELSVEPRSRSSARVTVGRHRLEAVVERWRPPSARSKRATVARTGKAELTAPMTGSVVEVLCTVGDNVSEGDVLMIIESMKMNNELRAPTSGIVLSIRVKGGDRVQGGDVLAEIEAASGKGESDSD
jgi:biotin carboxyl carrier protein